MKYPLSFFVIILFTVLNLLSCSDDPSSIGIDLLEGDYLIVNTFDTEDDTVTQFSSFFKEVVPLGLSSKVLIGKRDELEATTLMDFLFFIEDSLRQDFLDGNISVNQAFMELTPTYIYTDSILNMILQYTKSPVIGQQDSHQIVLLILHIMRKT